MGTCGHRKTYSYRRGWYCWRCENLARQRRCGMFGHDYSKPRWAGILGWRYYCVHCDDMDTRPRDEFDRVVAR